MDYLSLLVIICCAVFYYRVGEQEYGFGWLVSLISVVLWLIGTFAVGFGRIANLLVQVGLFFGLTIWNMLRRNRV